MRATDKEVITAAIEAATSACRWRRKNGLGNAARFSKLLAVSRVRVSQIRNGHAGMTKIQRLVCETIISAPDTAKAILDRAERTNA